MSKGLIPSPAVSLALKALGNSLLVYGMHVYLPQYVTVFGGLAACVVIGSLLTLLNLSLRPILSVITFPFRLLFTLFTAIAVNAFFLFVVHEIALLMDPNIVVFTVTGGIGGWLAVSAVLGIGNWILKHI